MVTGSLQVSNGKYYSVINLGKNSEGKRVQKRVPLQLEDIKGNKKLAKAKHLETLAFYNIPKPETKTMDSNVLFSDYLDLWLEEKKATIQITTYESYRATADKHVIPYFKQLGVCLSDISRENIQKFYDIQTKTLKVGTVKKQHALIRPALQKAVLDGLIENNPSITITFKRERTRFVGKFLTSEQTSDLLDKIKGSLIEPVIVLAIFLGLRRSEIAGLKWSAIDFERDRLEICHTVVRIKTTHAKDETKSESSNRILPLIPSVKSYLLELRSKQAYEKEILGKFYNDTDYVCRHSDGRPISPQYISVVFRRFLAKNNFPHIRLHDLRHTCASLLLESGCDMKTISEILGHSDISTTMNLYVHIYDESKRDALAKLGNILQQKSVT